MRKDEQIQAVWSPNLEKGHLIPHPLHVIYTQSETVALKFDF